jgi:hypothetical protein
MNTGRTVLIAVVRRWWVRGFGRCARGLPLKSHRRVGSNRILDHPGLRRSGDHLYLTAPLGRAARPWLALAKGRRSAREVWVEVRTRHRQPQQALPSSITFATSTSPRSNTACWRMRSISLMTARGPVQPPSGGTGTARYSSAQSARREIRWWLLTDIPQLPALKAKVSPFGCLAQ